MNTLRNLTGLLFGLVLGVLIGLALMPRAHSEDLGFDVQVPEDRMPVAAEFTYCDELSPEGKKTIWYVVVKLDNGDTLVFNAHHLHGFERPEDAFRYIKSAKQQTARHLPCPPQI